MKFEEHDAFNQDVKRLSEKHRSLREDLSVLKKILLILPGERPPFSGQLHYIVPGGKIIKVEKMACKSLKGRGVCSGLILIYVLFEASKKVVLIGMYESNKPMYEKNVLKRVDHLATTLISRR